MTETTTRSQRKRQDIVDAAVESFRDAGYHGTSMDTVAEAAGVSKRTVYNHFASKEELFQTIVEDLFVRGHEATRIDYDPEEQLDSQLAAFAIEKIDVALDPAYLGLFRAVFADLARSPELAARTFESTQRGEEGLVTWLKAAHRDGRIVVHDPKHAANQFWSLIKGELFWPLVLGARRTRNKRLEPKAIESSVRLFLDHYGVS